MKKTKKPRKGSRKTRKKDAPITDHHPYDSAFKTLLTYLRAFIAHVINVLFDTLYTENAKINPFADGGGDGRPGRAGDSPGDGQPS